MSARPPTSYEFGPFRFDVADRVLFRAGQSVTVTPKALELLLVLIQTAAPGEQREPHQPRLAGYVYRRK